MIFSTDLDPLLTTVESKEDHVNRMKLLLGKATGKEREHIEAGFAAVENHVAKKPTATQKLWVVERVLAGFDADPSHKTFPLTAGQIIDKRDSHGPWKKVE